MKTTIDLPDELLERTKIAAARRRTSIKNLVIEGLEKVLGEESPSAPPADALARLQQGYHLGGQPLTRDQSHGR
jgi:predicted DNA-binding protein